MLTTDRILTDEFLDHHRAWAADKVDEMADLLAERGWTKGAYDTTGKGPQCVQGAACEVTGVPIKGGNSHKPNFNYYTLRESLCRQLDTNHLPSWNDRHRSGKSVVAKLRKAAREIRGAA